MNICNLYVSTPEAIEEWKWRKTEDYDAFFSLIKLFNPKVVGFTPDHRKVVNVKEGTLESDMGALGFIPFQGIVIPCAHFPL